MTSCRLTAQTDTTITLQRLTINYLTLFQVAHTVVNRSQEERTNRHTATHTFGCGDNWTWEHHEELMWVRSRLQRKENYSVKSPVDLMRLLGNADRHVSRLYLHVIAMKALLDTYSELMCLTASLLPHLGDADIGLNQEHREVAANYLQQNPGWQRYFTHSLRHDQTLVTVQHIQ